MFNYCSRRDVLFLLAKFGLGAALAGCADPTIAGPPKRPLTGPNIIFILVDDLGDQELACRGNTFNETPHIDKLAAQGLTFSQAYAAAPVCSPTRAALLTGLAPARLGLTDFLKDRDEKYLSPAYLTVNEVLKSAGYITGLIGKWHLTGDYDKKLGDPSQHGWDEVILSETRYILNGDYFAPYDFMPEVDAPEGEYLTDRLHEEAVSFIQRHQDGPFFLLLSHYAVHTVLRGKPNKVEKYRNKLGAAEHNPELAAMLESVDEGVGQIVQTLRRTGLLDNTLLIFTSDNGADPTVMSPSTLRGAKADLYEGGVRVPLIAHWPAQIAPGTTCHAHTSTLDFYPTFAEVATAAASNKSAMIELPALDGESMTPLFKGETPTRSALYWHYPRAHPHPNGGRSSGAIRQGDYKLIEFFDTGERELYDLGSDAGEVHNLAASLPEKVSELRAQLSGWQAAVGAEQVVT